jgi:hypothetical protein
MKKRIAIVRQSLTQVFSDYRYITVAIAVACLAFALSVWLRNISLIVTAFTSSLFDVGDRLLLLLRLLGGIATADTVLVAVLTIIMSLLFGVNIALLIYYFVQRKKLPAAKESATTVGGIIAAVFGIGCSACGTLVLSAILSSVGATGLLALLPLGGGEFLISSIALLIASIYWIARSIQASVVCIPDELKDVHTT